MILMYGPKISASSRTRPERDAEASTPSTTPMTKPSTVSSSVTPICVHSEP